MNFWFHVLSKNYIRVLKLIKIIIGRPLRQRIPSKKKIDKVSELFISGRWDQVNRSALLTVKNQTPENLIFQHILIKEKIKTL